MSATTPGPWAKVMPLGDRCWTLGIIRDHIARPLESEADWRLGLAAPELLEAANYCLAQHEDIGCSCAGCARLRAAIKKASGDAP